MTNSKDDQSGIEFEKWYGKPECMRKDHEGFYIDGIVSSHFESWQASRATTSEAVRELVSSTEAFSNQLTIWFSAMNESQSPKNRAALIASWENTLQALARVSGEL